jgi:hypothetical protein
LFFVHYALKVAIEPPQLLDSLEKVHFLIEFKETCFKDGILFLEKIFEFKLYFLM